jgi:SulP family sulfate permease
MKTPSLNRETLPSDLLAGFVVAVTSIPDAMASAILAGLNPIQGLYAIMVGTPVGALATGSVFMTVAVTSAMALAVGDSLAGYSGDALLTAVITLTILVGLFALLVGVLRLGTLVRFVSNAVMTGFLTGVAVLIILGQLGDFTGYESQYSNKVARAIDLLLHLNAVDLQTLAIGLLTIALILLFGRTRLANFSMVLAMVLVTAALLLLGWDSVQLIGDIADIPRSLPTPKLPDPSLVPALIGPAIAIAIIGLVQGAGVGRGVPNPDGGYPDPSRDFDGQGLGNIAAGFFQGMPVGGSLSTTSINVNAGARTRWANIFSGVFVAILVLLFASLVELIPMASVAAILIVAGWGTLNFEEIGDVRDPSCSRCTCPCRRPCLRALFSPCSFSFTTRPSTSALRSSCPRRMACSGNRPHRTSCPATTLPLYTSMAPYSLRPPIPWSRSCPRRLEPNGRSSSYACAGTRMWAAPSSAS